MVQMKDLISYKKRCERCEIADIETHANHILFCSNQVGGLYGTNEKINTLNALISTQGRLDFLCALGWALIRDGR